MANRKNTDKSKTAQARTKKQVPANKPRRAQGLSRMQAEIVNAISTVKVEAALAAAAGTDSFAGSNAYVMTTSIHGFDINTKDFVSEDTVHHGYSSTGKILASATVEFLQPTVGEMSPSDSFLLTTGVACSLPADLPTATASANNGIVPMASRLTWVVPSNVPKWKTLFHCDYMALYNAGIYPVYLDDDATSPATRRRAFSIQCNGGDTDAALTTTTIGDLDVTLQLRVRLTWWDPVEDNVSVQRQYNRGASIVGTVSAAANSQNTMTAKAKVNGLKQLKNKR